MSALSVVSADRLISSMRRRSPAIERGDRARPCLSRSSSASSADWASRAPESAPARSRASSRRRRASCPEKGLEQAQQGAPALHRPAKIVHRLGLGPGRILDGRTRLGEDVVRHAAQRLPHRHARPQGGSVIHMKNIGHYCVRRLLDGDRTGAIWAFQAVSRLLHRPPAGGGPYFPFSHRLTRGGAAR